MCLPDELIKRVLGMDNLRNCVAAARINRCVRRVAAAAVTELPPAAGALCVAAEAGSLSLVRALLAAGADSTLPGPSGDVPLCIAARHGHAGVVRLLMAGGNQTSSSRHSAIGIACGNRDVDTVRALLGGGIFLELRRSSTLPAGHRAVIQEAMARKWVPLVLVTACAANGAMSWGTLKYIIDIWEHGSKNWDTLRRFIDACLLLHRSINWVFGPR